MKSIATLFFSLCFAWMLLLWTTPSALACEPLEEENGVGVSAAVCRLAKPSPPSTQSPASAASASTGTTNGASSASVPMDRPQSLSCLLPIGDALVNALGVSLGCATPPPPQRVVKAPAPTVAPTPVKTSVASVPQPKGDSPYSGFPIADKWYTLGPGENHWYKIDNGNNYYLDVWLDAYGRSGLTLSMYSPEQASQLPSNIPPKGRGSPAKNDPTHDLYWKGNYAYGTWYALVTNQNNFPVEYKLGSRQSAVDRRCWSYWETLPTGEYVLWTDCGNYTDTSNK